MVNTFAPRLRSLPVLGLTALFACSTGGDAPPKGQQTQAQAQKPTPPPPPKLDRVPRMELNRIAAELALPIFWVVDADGDGAVDTTELAALWGVRATTRAEWVSGDTFTPAFLEAYEHIAKVKAEGHPAAADEKEQKRRAAVLKELAQGRPTVVLTKLEGATAEDRAIVQNVLEAAATVEKIFAKQRGSAGMAEQIPATDTASRMLFYRNQAPWCVAPETEDDPDCNALASAPRKLSGLYPESIQRDDPAFCETLGKRKDAEALFDQFSVVVESEPGKLEAVPYTVAYKAEMESISRSLKAAADAIQSPNEAAFKAYLEAASQSFLTNDWNPADEAWSKMGVQNSKWYLRIGPDEVYFEPCSRKAGFHVSFARINQSSVEWQTKLDPLKGEMEEALAALAGKPYKARKVSFHLPDFIDIIINAGDSRDEHGATIGQSLPNWGPVANEGRGRTVAMTSFYTDPDSSAALRGQVESLFCAGSMAAYSDDYSPQLMSTVLHEAAHNLGPAHEYKVNGKTDDQAFGGPIASMMEELKSQTAADYFTDWLVKKGAVTQDVADKAHTRNVAWAFGHISRGMYADGKPRPYSQLAAIQLGFLLKEGAITWNAEELAANKTDKGCFALRLDQFPSAFEKLMKNVAGIKARGDKKGAMGLVADFVDQKGQTQELLETIKVRWLRAPKASFVYSVEL